MRRFFGNAQPFVKKAAQMKVSGDVSLLKLSMVSVLNELAKLGTVSDLEAEKALDRYESLEKNKPTLGQVGRYAALGAAAGPVIAATGNAIAGGRGSKSLLGHLAGARGPGAMSSLRGVAGSAATGAISSGAIPLVRAHLDRRAEMGTLQKYLAEQPSLEAGKLSPPFEPVEKEAGKKEKDSAASGLTPARYWDGKGMYLNAAFGEEKTAFQTSQYDAGIGTPAVRQVSQMPGFTRPSLRKMSDGEAAKLASQAVTPRGRAIAAMRVGLPRVTAPSGPSIAQVSKPQGFGRPIAGAIKSGI